MGDDGDPTITDRTFSLTRSLSNVLAEYDTDPNTSAMGGEGLKWDEPVHPLYHATVLCTGDCEWTVVAAFRLTGPEPPNPMFGPDTRIRGPMLFTCTHDAGPEHAAGRLGPTHAPVYCTLHDDVFPELYSAANAAADAIAKEVGV